jgi:hypothetical protein
LQSVEDAGSEGADAEGRLASEFFTVDLDMGLVE